MNVVIVVIAGNEIGRNCGALPRLRGRGAQRDIIDHCLTLSTLYIALIGELRRVPFLRGRQSQPRSADDRAQHGQGFYRTTPPCLPRPRKRGNAPRVATPPASQARQRSTGGDPSGLASEAALHGWRPLRPRKRGNAPRVATPPASQARQRSTGGDPSGLASEATLHGWRPSRPRPQSCPKSKIS